MVQQGIYTRKLDRIFRDAATLRIDDGSKIVIMSDCHRGSGNLADDFAGNKMICYAALAYYNRQGYTYIELGDGDELWQCKTLSEITAAHGDIFALLEQFSREKRLYMLYGNHDLTKKYGFLPDISVTEGLVLKYGGADGALLLIHGHQVDFFNDTLWRLARFLVRYVWKPLELIGLQDPTSAAKNNKVKEKVERYLTDWAAARRIPVIAGHTHRPVFPQPGEGRYFNDGSCVQPLGITALEIEHGLITLVLWEEKTKADGTVYIGKNAIAGPKEIKSYVS